MGDLHTLDAIGAAKTFVPTARGGDGVAKGVVRPTLTSEDMRAREWLLNGIPMLSRPSSCLTRFALDRDSLSRYHRHGTNFKLFRLVRLITKTVSKSSSRQKLNAKQARWATSSAFCVRPSRQSGQIPRGAQARPMGRQAFQELPRAPHPRRGQRHWRSLSGKTSPLGVAK